ncbi:MAG: TIM barrel protein [Alphaproteobacteria bacterium]|nr:TIM barrel protein [Alphaproteobacteria bacterium]
MKNRRSAVKTILTATMALPFLPKNSLGQKSEPLKLNGNIKQSVCRWCFDFLPLEELCLAANNLGLVGIDLVGPADWATLKKYNLVSTMCNGAEINLVDGFNNPQYHTTLVKNYLEHIQYVSAAGYKNLICFSGNRRGMDDETGLKNCIIGLKKILGLAEQKGVMIQMELLNSKIDHKDYMCDKSAWGIELCKRLDSPNFKLLYDIYHMQIDEGDVIRTIKDHHVYFGHYHTAGVPGRHEINAEIQELSYPPIMKAIYETGFKDYVAQEFIPTYSNKIAALRESVLICDI